MNTSPGEHCAHLFKQKQLLLNIIYNQQDNYLMSLRIRSAGRGCLMLVAKPSSPIIHITE